MKWTPRSSSSTVPEPSGRVAALCCSSLKRSSKVFMGLGYRKAGATLTDRCPMTSVEPGRLAALSTGACDGVSHRRVMSCPEVFHRVSSGSGLGALGQVMSMHRLDGQCRPAGRGMELFRWRGGFRVECVPTTCCAHRGQAARIRSWPGGRVRAAPRTARPSRPPAPRRRGAGGAGRRRGAAKQPAVRAGAASRRIRA